MSVGNLRLFDQEQPANEAVRDTEKSCRHLLLWHSGGRASGGLWEGPFTPAGSTASGSMDKVAGITLMVITTNEKGLIGSRPDSAPDLCATAKHFLRDFRN